MAIFLGTNDYTAQEMSKIEALRLLVNERLSTATADIFGMIEKTIIEYEVQASRLQHEINSQRRLVDSLLLKKQDHHTTAPAPPPSKGCTPAPPPSKGCTPAPPPSKGYTSKRGSGSGVPSHSLELQYVFTSDADLMNFAANKNCPYCHKGTVATEMHLIKKHYSNAIHFTEKGIGKFVVPCTCKERNKDRSHWHCHICKKTISRKTNFKVHLYKIHGCELQEQFQDTEIHQASVSPCEDWFLPEQSWQEEELSPGLGQEELEHLDSLQIKKEQEELWSSQREQRPQVVHQEQQCYVGQGDPEPPQIKEEEGEGEEEEEEEDWNSAAGVQLRGLKEDDNKNSIFSMTCVEGLNQDSARPSSRRNRTQRVEDPLPGSSAEPMETWDGEGCGASALAGDRNPLSPYCSVAEVRARDRDDVWKRSARPQSGLKTLKSWKTKTMERHLSHVGMKSQSSMQYSAGPNPTDPSCCKVCGKSFHYMYTLLNHAKTHAGDASRLCGVCGKQLETTECVVQHLKTHVNWGQTT